MIISENFVSLTIETIKKLSKSLKDDPIKCEVLHTKSYCTGSTVVLLASTCKPMNKCIYLFVKVSLDTQHNIPKEEEEVSWGGGRLEEWAEVEARALFYTLDGPAQKPLHPTREFPRI